jgi:glycosyltransferase involved in cell wall biosynthesis
LEKCSVLNAITGLNIGGAEIMLARYAKALQSTAFEPQVLSLMTPGAVADALSDAGIPVRTLDMQQSRVRLHSIAGLRRSVSEAKPDLLHGWMYHGNLAASLGSFMDRRQPVIWSIHHSVHALAAEKRLTRWLIIMLARLSKHVAAISYCSRVSAEQHEALGFDPSKRIIIPNGIDCATFRPDEYGRQRLHTRFNIPDDRLVIGNVARAHPMKDHESFVRALARLRQFGLNVHGLIIGAGHEHGKAQTLANTLGVADRLTTPGPLSDVSDLLPGLDAFLLSSAWGEAFPLSVAEAMACGVPAVVTNVGDCAWLVGDRNFIAAAGEPDSQAAILRRILTLTSEERRALGLRGRDRVIRNFSLHEYTERHLALYEAVMSQSQLRKQAA